LDKENGKEMILQVKVKGSASSGNWRHSGIPGQVGGSLPGGSGSAVSSLMKQKQEILDFDREEATRKLDYARGSKTVRNSGLTIGRRERRDLVLFYDQPAKKYNIYDVETGTAPYLVLREGKQVFQGNRKEAQAMLEIICSNVY